MGLSHTQSWKIIYFPSCAIFCPCFFLSLGTCLPLWAQRMKAVAVLCRWHNPQVCCGVILLLEAFSCLWMRHNAHCVKHQVTWIHQDIICCFTVSPACFDIDFFFFYFSFYFLFFFFSLKKPLIYFLVSQALLKVLGAFYTFWFPFLSLFMALIDQAAGCSAPKSSHQHTTLLNHILFFQGGQIKQFCFKSAELCH